MTAAIDSGPGAVINDAVGYGRGFVRVGSRTVGSAVDGVIESSPDGLHWTLADVATSGLANAEVDHVAASGTRLVAIGLDRDNHPVSVAPHLVWVSDDGLRWQRLDAPKLVSLASGPDTRSGLAGGAGGFEAWSTTNVPGNFKWQVVLHSADGSTWTEADAAEVFNLGAIHAMAAYRGDFLAAGVRSFSPSGPAGMIWSSPGGLGWTNLTIDREVLLNRIVAGTSVAFVSGFDIGGFGIHVTSVWKSTDGATWTFVKEIPGGNLPQETYVADGTRIVRIVITYGSATGFVAWTEDGVAWMYPGSVPAAPTYLGGSYVVGSSGLLITMPPTDDAHPEIHRTLFVPAS